MLVPKRGHRLALIPTDPKQGIRPAALSAALALAASIAACGGSTAPSPAKQSAPSAAQEITPASTSGPRGPGGYLKVDGDKDGDDGPEAGRVENDDHEILFEYRRATRAERNAISAVVRRYLTAAEAGDGAEACSMLSSGIIVGLVADQAKPGTSPANACPAAIQSLLERRHRPLSVEHIATMTVTAVYVHGDLGLAMLGFKASPESDLLVEREGGRWKVDAVFDTQIT